MNILPENLQTSDDDRTLYARQMERVKLRIEEASTLVQAGHDERSVLYAAAQLRIAIEEVAFASLVGNRRAMEEAERTTKSKDWETVRKSLRMVNPGYWPRGIEQVRKNDGKIEWVDAVGGLKEHECGRARGRLSGLLHARSPWLPDIDWQSERSFISTIQTRLQVTLNEHLVSMVGGEELLCCTVWSNPVRVYAFGLVEE